MSKLLEPRMLFEWAHDLARSYSFFDCHVHPFDVLEGDVAYRSNEQTEMLFSKGNLVYHEPVADQKIGSDTQSPIVEQDSARAFVLASRFKYLHTGTKVIKDQLNTAGLSGALLLPVARVPGKAEEMLQASRMMFQHDNSLYIGCAFPVGVSADKLAKFFSAAREIHQIRAIKIHPNLAGIDLCSSEGQDLMEATLEAAGALRLPIVIHAGRTMALKPSDSVEYGMLSHFERINWSLSTAPVILAHAGCYELTESEANVTLSNLDLLFQKYPNLMADTSNLAIPLLRLVLKKVSPDRLVFGSDALYVPIWKAWLTFLHALQDISHSPDNDLIQIASLNPTACLGLSTAKNN
jgi:predicted TIM-barrel fold metal-dependent hydrolase